MKAKALTQVITKTATTAQPQCAVREPPNDAAATPCEVRIRDLAHQKWRAAGCPEGDGVEFWLEAERDLASLS